MPLRAFRTSTLRRAKSLVGDESGSELVEFGIAALIFLVLLISVIEFSLVVYANNAVALAAQQGSRYAMVHGADWSSPCTSASSYGCSAVSGGYVQQYVVNHAMPGVHLQTSNITVTWMTTKADGAACTQGSQGCQVKVAVSYSCPLAIPPVTLSISLSSASIETIQN